MVIKERIDKANIHLYMKKIQAKGYRKVGKEYGRNFYKIFFERTRGMQVEKLTMRYTDNGWLSIY